MRKPINLTKTDNWNNNKSDENNQVFPVDNKLAQNASDETRNMFRIFPSLMSITGSEVAGQGTNERVNNVNTPAQWSIIKRGN